MVGIISNNSALKAQSNLEKANLQTETSIARLSSGNRIQKASEDVAALSVGKIFETNVSTMKAALTNAAQASSLLALADGALSNISQVLQRQKALASQATSGSLDDVARSFLDQEFQNLKQEVDRISTTTNFNGIKLIDGNLFNATKLTSNVNLNSTPVSGTLVFSADSFDADDEAFTLNSDTALNGYSATTFTAKANTKFSKFPNNLLEFEATGGDASLDNILLMIESLRKYTGEDATINAAKKNVSAFDFEKTAALNLKVTAKTAGSSFDNVIIKADNNTTAIKLDGTDIKNTAVKLGASGVKGYDGGLPGSDMPATGGTLYKVGAQGATLPTVFANGNVSDSLLSALAIDGATTGVNLAEISNNPDFIGNMPKFTAKYNTNDNSVDIEVTVGGIKYSAAAVDTNPGADTHVTLSSADAGYGQFHIVMSNGNGMSVTSQTDADTFVARLNKAFDKIDIYQRREISNYIPAGTVYATGSTTNIGNLSGSKFWMINNDFSSLQVEDVKVVAPPSGSTEAIIEITINGEIYRSGYDYDGSVLAIGNTIANNEGNGPGNMLAFVNQTNPSKILQFDYANATALSMTNDAEAEGVELALKEAFGIGNGTGSGLSFQVGTKSTDSIKVQIQSTKSRDIFIDSNGLFKDLNVKTQEKANEAGDILDNAINHVTSVRAQVGSLQSRFNFAQASIKSSIENFDASRSLFQDVNVAEESTAFAQAQVRLQASVSALAQANQIPQTFLKLIG